MCLHLRGSMTGQGARAKRKPGRAHAQHNTPAGTTKHNTPAPRQTPTPNNKQAATNKSGVRTAQQPRQDGRVSTRQQTRTLPATKTAALRMNLCTPGSEPSPCRLQNRRRSDGCVRARQ